MTMFPCTTLRLRLRPLRLDDAGRVKSFANDPEIARFAANIPHPYPEGLAELWIEQAGLGLTEGRDYALAIASKDKDEFLGAISLKIKDYVSGGEIGYWVARPYWRQGLATEACKAMAIVAFNRLGLPKLWAGVRPENEGSLNLLSHLGFVDQGTIDYDFPAHGCVRKVRLLVLDRMMARAQSEPLGAAILHL